MTDFDTQNLRYKAGFRPENEKLLRDLWIKLPPRRWYEKYAAQLIFGCLLVGIFVSPIYKMAILAAIITFVLVTTRK